MSGRLDALVIGAGLSGLSAGIAMQVSGLNTMLVERHKLPGGLNSFYRQGGHLFSSGLHAMTGYNPGRQDAHLNLAARFLEIPLEDLDLIPPAGSSLINTPLAVLEFGNDIEILIESLRGSFPSEVDSFMKFLQTGSQINAAQHIGISSRDKLRQFFSDDLAEVLLFPVMFYAGYKPGEIDFYTYWNVFKSLFLDGICIPRSGMRHVLQVLTKKYRDSGGILRFGNGVQSILLEDGRAKEAALDSGETIEADQIFSCAGIEETTALITGQQPARREAANISVFESVFVTDTPVRSLGYPYAIAFNALTQNLKYDLYGLANQDSFLIACMDNYNHNPVPEHGMLKVCSIADYRQWRRIPAEEYAERKTSLAREMLARANRLIPGIADRVIYTTTFSPLTIERYTGHLEGSVYGAPFFTNDGTIESASNVFITGNDQGSVGISGALLSGVFMAVKHAL